MQSSAPGDSQAPQPATRWRDALLALEKPATDFDDPGLEWRRLFSELLGTFFLVLVGAGGAVVNATSQGMISRTAAVAAPGLMVMARCDNVRCRKTVVRKSATWHTSKPTTTATRIPGTFVRYPTYQLVDTQVPVRLA